MNDCVWVFICACKEECKCSKYQSVNEPAGREILKSYTREVDMTLEPIQKKWKNIFEDGGQANGK